MRYLESNLGHYEYKGVEARILAMQESNKTAIMFQGSVSLRNNSNPRETKRPENI
jgi:HKD family nuclease